MIRSPTRVRRVRLRVNRSGQATVEFVLIAPILLLLIMGLVDFARAWSAHHAIADAAREGARMLVVHDPNVTGGDAEATITNRLATASLDPARATITCNDDACSTIAEPAQGDPMKVTIDYAYDFWILGAFMNFATGERQVNLISTITMRSE